MSTSRDSLRASSPITAAISSRSCWVSDGEPTASPAAEIAVSGERRSCETARNSAVLTVSALRSAAVSTTSPSSRSRSSAALSSASSAGTTRSCRRRRLASDASAPTSSVPSRLVPSRSGNATLRSSPSTASISIAAEPSSNACARRAAAVGSASPRLSPRSSRRAISAARSASRLRASASRARARDTSATELASSATTRNAHSATQLLESRMVNRPTGGRWKKFSAAALSTAVATPSQPPQITDTISTAGRYTTDSDTTGATCLSGYTISVHSATDSTATITPTRRDGGSDSSRKPSGEDIDTSA